MVKKELTEIKISILINQVIIKEITTMDEKEKVTEVEILSQKQVTQKKMIHLERQKINENTENQVNIEIDEAIQEDDKEAQQEKVDEEVNKTKKQRF